MPQILLGKPQLLPPSFERILCLILRQVLLKLPHNLQVLDVEVPERGTSLIAEDVCHREDVGVKEALNSYFHIIPRVAGIDRRGPIRAIDIPIHLTNSLHLLEYFLPLELTLSAEGSGAAV